MTDPRAPEGGSDALDEAYRRASAADSSRPSEATRAAILANARAVAAAAREPAKPLIDVSRKAANDPFWWRSAAASVALAVLALMVWAPHFESGGGRHDAATLPATAPAAGAPVPAAPPPAPAASPPALLASGPDPSMATRQGQLAAPATRREAPTEARRAAAPPPPGQEFANALAAPAAEPPAVAAPSVSASASADARADTAVAEQPAAAVPSATERAAIAGAPPAAAARRAELQEIVVTGGRGRSAPTPAPPAAKAAAVAPQTPARDKYASDAVAGISPDAALEAAIARGDAERVRDLVAPAGALEARDARGRTPLMRAVVAGQVGIVRALLDAGADANAADADGATPRARAAKHPDIAALLEAHGGH